MTRNISIIVAMDETGGIGKNNQLLCHLPADLKYFKEKTLHKPIVMGRKTYESIGRPLPSRENIVLSRTSKIIPGVRVINSVEEILMLPDPEIMIIGGAEIFQWFLPVATHLLITRIHHRFDADVFFPPVDWSIWHLFSTLSRPSDEKNVYPLTFEVFHRVEVKKPSY